MLSHQTAALAYGWPVGLATLDRVHLTAIELASRSRLVPGAVLHHSGTVANHIQRRGEDLLTEPARTVADGAIRAGDTTLAQVRDVPRERAIEHTGLGVVRWSTPEIDDDPAEVAQRVISAQGVHSVQRGVATQTWRREVITRNRLATNAAST